MYILVRNRLILSLVVCNIYLSFFFCSFVHFVFICGLILEKFVHYANLRDLGLYILRGTALKIVQAFAVLSV